MKLAFKEIAKIKALAWYIRWVITIILSYWHCESVRGRKESRILILGEAFVYNTNKARIYICKLCRAFRPGIIRRSFCMLLFRTSRQGIANNSVENAGASESVCVCRQRRRRSHYCLYIMWFCCCLLLRGWVSACLPVCLRRCVCVKGTTSGAFHARFEFIFG